MSLLSLPVIVAISAPKGTPVPLHLPHGNEIAGWLHIEAGNALSVISLLRIQFLELWSMVSES